MHLALFDSEGNTRRLSEEQARAQAELDPRIRREWIKWRKMTGREGTLILLRGTHGSSRD